MNYTAEAAAEDHTQAPSKEDEEEEEETQEEGEETSESEFSGYMTLEGGETSTDMVASLPGEEQQNVQTEEQLQLSQDSPRNQFLDLTEISEKEKKK